MSMYCKHNKNEREVFKFQRVYTAKLPDQRVVSILSLPMQESTSHTLSCWDGILPIFVFLPQQTMVPAILLHECLP